MSHHQYLRELSTALGSHKTTASKVRFSALKAFEDEFSDLKAKLSWFTFEVFTALEDKLP